MTQVQDVLLALRHCAFVNVVVSLLKELGDVFLASNSGAETSSGGGTSALELVTTAEVASTASAAASLR